MSTQIPFGCDESCSCSEMREQSACFAMPEWLQVALNLLKSSMKLSESK